MTEPTGEIDRLIKEALRHEDTDLRARFGEQSAPELLMEMFRGRRRLITIGGIIANLVLVGLAILSTSRFLNASDQRSMLIWGVTGVSCLVAITAIKVWYWLEMTRLSLARDIKRVELQLALLAKQIADRGHI